MTEHKIPWQVVSAGQNESCCNIIDCCGNIIASVPDWKNAELIVETVNKLDKKSVNRLDKKYTK